MKDLSLPVAHAQEEEKGYWYMKEAYCGKDCPYKNRIFVLLQKKLEGIPIEDRKKFVMQLYQENGSLDVWSTHNDRGRAYGIGQWNVANAKRYLAEHCAKNEKGECDYDLELERQLTLLANDMRGAYEKYRGNIRLAIIDHNRPASAARGVDQCLSGPTDGNDPGINDCYYAEQVMQHKEKFELR